MAESPSISINTERKELVDGMIFFDSVASNEGQKGDHKQEQHPKDLYEGLIFYDTDVSEKLDTTKQTNIAKPETAAPQLTPTKVLPQLISTVICQTTDPPSQLHNENLPATTAGHNARLMNEQPPERIVPRKNGKLTAYDVAEELMQKGMLVCVGNGLYFYNGKHYQLLNREEISRFIMAHCRSAVQSVGDAIFIDKIYRVIFAEPSICMKPCAPSPDILVFEDGILDTRTWKLTQHTPIEFTTSMIRTNYTHGCQGSCPRFSAFIEQIAGHDAVLVTRFWQAIGYLITQDMRGKCFIVFQGVSDSGKSVLGNFIRNCFDQQFTTSLDINSFAKDFALADLIGKRLCVDLDLPDGVLSNKAVSMLKKMTGGDALSTDVKFMSRVTFINSAKLLFATNHAIVTAGNDPAFLRRMVILPFFYGIPREQQNEQMPAVFETERDSIVVKALSYYAQLREHHYQFAGEYAPNQLNMNRGCADLPTCVASFLTQCCRQDTQAWTPTQVLYRAFSRHYPGLCNMNTFSRQLERICTQRYPGKTQKDRNRQRGEKNPVNGFTGICLNSADCISYGQEGGCIDAKG